MIKVSASNALCSACGRVFRTSTEFFLHRDRGKCIDPASLGMVLDERGHWRLENRRG